jgi:hypothetical protein
LKGKLPFFQAIRFTAGRDGAAEGAEQGGEQGSAGVVNSPFTMRSSAAGFCIRSTRAGTCCGAGFLIFIALRPFSASVSFIRDPWPESSWSFPF